MTISVIIPTYNRPEHLRIALAALCRSNCAFTEFEVIVVDDGGSFDLEPIAAAVPHGISVTLIRQPNGGPASARNAGARIAAGRFLAFIDDDCEPASGWISALMETLSTNPDAMAGGTVLNGLPDNCYAAASQAISDFCLAHYNANPSDGRFFPSNNFAVAAALYHRVGGFDASFRISGGEDREFNDRWKEHGMKLVYARGAILRHRHRMNFLGFLRQHFTYGRGGLLYARTRRSRIGASVPFEGWSFHLGIVAAPFRKGLFLRALHLSALIFVSQAAVLAGYLWESLAIPTADSPAKSITRSTAASLPPSRHPE